MKTVQYKNLLIMPRINSLMGGGFSVEVDIVKNWGESTALLLFRRKFVSEETATAIGVACARRAIDNGEVRF
jgi:hypothetical protein